MSKKAFVNEHYSTLILFDETKNDIFRVLCLEQAIEHLYSYNHICQLIYAFPGFPLINLKTQRYKTTSPPLNQPHQRNSDLETRT